MHMFLVAGIYRCQSGMSFLVLYLLSECTLLAIPCAMRMRRRHLAMHT